MRFTRLKTKFFAAVSECDIAFGSGLNVIYGPNETGKSTLTQAIRAALLLQHTSRLHRDWVPWSGSGAPQVELTLETEPGEYWRITKTFAASGRSQLDQSKDGTNFRKAHSGRRVDAEIRKLLRWGLPETGKSRGLPDAFLTAVLLPEQGDTVGLLDRDMQDDKDESGKQLLNEAMQAMSTDPLFKHVLLATGRQYDSAFTATGRRSNASSSPFREINDRIKKAEERRERLQEKKQQAESVESELKRLHEDLSTRIEALRNAKSRLEQMSQSAAELTGLRKEIATQNEAFAALRNKKTTLDELEKQATSAADETAKTAEKLKQAASDLEAASKQVQSIEKQIDDLTNDPTSAKQMLEQREREQKLKNAEERLKLLRTQQDHTNKIQELDGQLTELNDEIADLQSQSAKYDSLRKWHQSVVTAKRCENIEAAASQQKEIAKLKAALPAEPPTRDEVNLVAKLESEIQIAKVKAGVELRVQITPERELTLTTQSGGDKAKTQTTSERVELTAESPLRIDLADVGTIEVSAGDAANEKTLSQLLPRWEQEAKPVLSRCKCETSAALREVEDSASALSRQQQALSDTLERLALKESDITSALKTAEAEKKNAAAAFGESQADHIAAQIELLASQPIEKRLQAIEGLASQSTTRLSESRAGQCCAGQTSFLPGTV